MFQRRSAILHSITSDGRKATPPSSRQRSQRRTAMTRFKLQAAVCLRWISVANPDTQRERERDLTLGEGGVETLHIRVRFTVSQRQVHVRMPKRK